jgi:hypothetical protein
VSEQNLQQVARDAILSAIAEKAPNAGPEGLRHLAEAMAALAPLKDPERVGPLR